MSTPNISDQTAINWIWGCNPNLSIFYAQQKGLWPDCGETTNDVDNPRSDSQKAAIVKDWITVVDPRFAGMSLQQVAGYFNYTANPDYTTLNWDWLFQYLYDHRQDIRDNFANGGPSKNYWAFKMSLNAAPCQWNVVLAMRAWWRADSGDPQFGNLAQLQSEVQGVYVYSGGGTPSPVGTPGTGGSTPPVGPPSPAGAPSTGGGSSSGSPNTGSPPSTPPAPPATRILGYVDKNPLAFGIIGGLVAILVWKR